MKTDILIRKILNGPEYDRSGLLQAHDGVVIEYAVTDHAGDIIAAHLHNSPSPYLLFIDDVCLLQPEVLHTITNLAATDEATVYLPQDAGIRSVFGNPEDGDIALPSCCCMVPSSFFATAPGTVTYATTEFFLLSQAYKKTCSSRAIDVPGLGFDAVNWAGNLVLATADALANDYQNFLLHEGMDALAFVPPQFRISTHHRAATIHLPGDAACADGYPRFSIICPVFKPDFLREMINSVCQQTWPHWELLIAVDGPPQPAFEEICMILSATDDQRISYYFQDNKGTGATRKELSEQATGDFILSIDDDDMLVPDTLKVFAGAVLSNPGSMVFRGDTQIVGLVEHLLTARKRFLVNGISNDTFEVNQPYIIQTNFLHRIGGYMPDAALRNAGEDTFLFHKLDQLGTKIEMVQVPLYLRRLSTKNLSLEFKVQEAMAHFNNIDEQFTPEGWTFSQRKFALEGNFQTAFAAYYHEADERAVVTGNRFFQYQTLSDLNKLTIDLEVTSRCNAVCGFCPRDAMPDTKSFVAIETVKKLAANIKHGPQKLVVLCGIGESLLHPQIEQIVRILTEANAYVAMTSNGALMTEKMFRKLLDAGLRSINFSVNAATADTHTTVMGMKNFNKVVTNVRRALEIKKELNSSISVNVSFVVCEQNAHEADTFIEQWRDSTATQMWLHPVNNRAGLLGAGMKSVRMEHFFEKYAGDDRVVVDVFRDHDETGKLCKIARHLAFISADGNMRLCAMDYERVTNHGNINSKSLQQLQFEKLSGFVKGDYDSLCHKCDFCPSELKKQLAV